MVICLEQGADLHMSQLMPLSLTVLASVKSRLVLPFWYRLIYLFTYFGFVDVEKAFDRVPREVISWAMRKFGLVWVEFNAPPDTV